MHIFNQLLNWIFPQDVIIENFDGIPPCPWWNETISSLFNYRDPKIRNAIWQLKYQGNRHIAHLLGSLLSQAIIQKNIQAPLIIPLPLSKKRLKERGWSQTEMLVRSIMKNDTTHSLEYGDKILIKIRHTYPQTKLSRSERKHNLKDCFAINSELKNKEIILRRNIILIDDVSTTGSTIFEAQKTLQAAGARSVCAFTVAH